MLKVVPEVPEVDGGISRNHDDTRPAPATLLGAEHEAALHVRGGADHEALTCYERVLDACRAASGVPLSGVPSRERVAPKLALSLIWRELDVLQLMDAHLTTGEMARLLGIGEKTVEQHAANIYKKLQVTGRRDAMLRAYDLGVLRA